MRRSANGGPWVLALMCGLAAVGCSSVRYADSGPAKSRGHGPPPHAPAHGYRAKTQEGLELSFRSDLGVYVVVGAQGHYYHDGLFYRHAAGRWSMGTHIDGPWQSVTEAKLPPGLRPKAKGRVKVKGKIK